MAVSRTMPDAVRRSRLCKKLVKLVAPEGMTYEQYVIECAANGIEVALDNGMFLHWLLTAKGPSYIASKVQILLVKAVEDGYLLDPNNVEQLEYFRDAMVDLVFMDKDYTKAMYDAVLTTTKNTIPTIFDAVKQINKGIGITTTEYFNNG